MANLLRTIYTKFYQNWPGFVEDMSDKNILVYLFRFTVYIPFLLSHFDDLDTMTLNTNF